MSGIYTYWLYDLVSNQPITQLPLKQVQLSTKLNDVGMFTATLAMNDPGVQLLQPKAALQLARTALFVDRDGTLIWGGLVWTRRYVSADRTLQIAGNDFLTYFQHRFLTTTKTYSAQSPQAIAQDLVTWSALTGGGNIGIQINVEGSSPQQVTQTWNPWDLKGISEALTSLSSTAPGFDMAVDVAWSGGAPQKTLTLSYPRRGRTAPNTGLLWEYPNGNVANYEWAEDGTLVAGTVYEVGAGQGASMLLTAGSTPALIDAGYPLLEAVQQHKDVTDSGTLAAFASADATAFAAPVANPVFYVRADKDPVLGAYEIGDDARFRLTDSWFPQPAGGGAGFDGYLRLVQIDVAPQDTQGEQVTLTAGPVTS